MCEFCKINENAQNPFMGYVCEPLNQPCTYCIFGFGKQYQEAKKALEAMK